MLKAMKFFEIFRTLRAINGAKLNSAFIALNDKRQRKIELLNVFFVAKSTVLSGYVISRSGVRRKGSHRFANNMFSYVHIHLEAPKALILILK